MHCSRKVQVQVRTEPKKESAVIPSDHGSVAPLMVLGTEWNDAVYMETENYEEVPHSRGDSRLRRPEREQRWINVIRKLKRLRRLQRLFGYIGQHLQGYPGTLRSSLQRHVPKIQGTLSHGGANDGRSASTA